MSITGLVYGNSVGEAKMTKIKMLCRNGALALSLLLVGVPAGYVQAAGTTDTETTTTTQDAQTTTPATTTPPNTAPTATQQTDDEGNWGWVGLLGLLGLAGLMGRNRNEGRNVVVDGTKR